MYPRRVIREFDECKEQIDDALRVLADQTSIASSSKLYPREDWFHASVSLMKPSVDLGIPIARKSKPLISILLQRFEDGIFPPGGASTFMTFGTLRRANYRTSFWSHYFTGGGLVRRKLQKTRKGTLWLWKLEMGEAREFAGQHQVRSHLKLMSMSSNNCE